MNIDKLLIVIENRYKRRKLVLKELVYSEKTSSIVRRR